MLLYSVLFLLGQDRNQAKEITTEMTSVADGFPFRDDVIEYVKKLARKNL